MSPPPAEIGYNRAVAVYTDIADAELRSFLEGFDLGTLVSVIGIAEGVENSNYLLLTGRGRFILTLYEKRVRRRDLPFFLGLMRHLSARGIACPTPVAARGGAVLHHLAGRPAAIVSFLEGVWPRRIWPEHCRALGGALADLHLAGRGYAASRANDLSVAGFRPLLASSAARAGEVMPGAGRRARFRDRGAGGRLAARPAARHRPRRPVSGQRVLPRRRGERDHRLLFRLR